MKKRFKELALILAISLILPVGAYASDIEEPQTGLGEAEEGPRMEDQEDWGTETDIEEGWEEDAGTENHEEAEGDIEEAQDEETESLDEAIEGDEGPDLDAALMTKAEACAYIDKCLADYVPYVDMSRSPLTYDEINEYFRKKGALDNRYVSSARGYRIDFVMGDGEWTVKGLYNDNFKDSSYVARWKAFDDKCARIAGMADPGWSDFEKALFVYDYLCKTNTTIMPSRSDSAYDAAHDGTGAVLDGNSVCSGLTIAYQAILRRLGVKAYIVTGDDIAHAWAAVLINGKLYHADLLEGAGGLGSGSRGDVNYSFFLRSGEWIESIYGPYCYNTEDGWFDETDDPARYNDRHEGSASGDWGKETGAFGYYKGFWYNASSVRNWAAQAGWARRYRCQNESLVFDGRAFDKWDSGYSGFALYGDKAYTAKDKKLYVIDMATGKASSTDISGSKVLYTDVDGILYTDKEELVISRISTKEDIKTGWQTVSGKSYYYGTDGVMCTGWQTISGKKYYLGTDGAMLTGWQTISGKKYYLGTDGAMRTGWQTVSGKKYYLGADGAMLTGWQTISSKKYYLGTDGVMCTGWQEISGKKYYLGSDGVIRSGWQTVDKKKYYLGTDGVMKTLWQTIDGKKYYFGTDGVMRTGWQEVSGKKYYLGTDGVMKTLWQELSGRKYYFGTDGAMRSGWQTVSERKYHFGTDGIMQTGWQLIDGRIYHFVQDGYLSSGWQDIDGNRYHFDQDGTASTGICSLSGRTYCFDKEGRMQTGWQTVSGKKHYFGTDGAMLTGWQAIDGARYFFDTDGTMKTGWPVIAGRKYYLGSDGILRTGWQTINGFKYYMGSDGEIRMGFHTISGKTYYFFPETADGHYRGTMATGWKVLSGKTYYFGSDGKMRTGWQTINGFKYYFGTNGVQFLGLRTISGRLYYFWQKTGKGHYKGTMARSCTVRTGNTTYKIDQNGKAVRK